GFDFDFVAVDEELRPEASRCSIRLMSSTASCWADGPWVIWPASNWRSSRRTVMVFMMVDACSRSPVPAPDLIQVDRADDGEKADQIGPDEVEDVEHDQ